MLWQGAPRPNTFLSPVGMAVCLAFIAGGGLAAYGALDNYISIPGEPLSGTRILLALVVVGPALVIFSNLWNERGANWAYAITDRRVLSIRGDKLMRSLKPGEIREFKISADAVWWRALDPDMRWRNRKRERRHPGFHGLDNPEDMLRTLEAWRDGFSRWAGESAAEFLKAESKPATAAEPSAGDSEVPDAIRRIHHDRTGVTIDVPAAWAATMSNDRIGPLRIFGVTLLETLIRPGEEQPYRDGAGWNNLIVRGAPDSGLTLTIRQEPLTKTLDEVLNDPWAEIYKLKVLKTTKDLSLGGLHGFSLVRQMPAGANLAGFGKVAQPVATRHAWLGQGHMYVEIIAMARLDQPDVQRAVDAMIESIRIA
ncbi:hypothetical protein [Methyloligella solikamskensis]|uniref:Uncharacterized protein n=1 Tax=Methyloligella solikamskensis TaxID=1177756 RepID=A0ABW3J5K9_9HYPH